jgi:hypothetical protein
VLCGAAGVRVFENKNCGLTFARRKLGSRELSNGRGFLEVAVSSRAHAEQFDATRALCAVTTHN